MLRADLAPPTLDSTKNKEEVIVKPIPYFPIQGNLEDINSQNDQLLSPQEMQIFDATQKYFDEHNTCKDDNKYPRGFFDFRRSIYKGANDFYTSYTVVGAGKSGKTRLLRSHTTKEWAILKTIPMTPAAPVSKTSTEELIKKMDSVKEEHAHLQKLQLSLAEIGKRTSTPKTAPSAKPELVKWNLMMKLAPGVELFCLDSPDIVLPDVLWLHLLSKSAAALHALHSHPTYPLYQCDIKSENLICDLSTRDKAITPVDYGAAIPISSTSQAHPKTMMGNFLHATSQQKAEFQKESKLVLAGETYTGGNIVNLQTEIHALGILFANLLNLLNPPHVDANDANFNLREYVQTLNPHHTYIVDETHPEYISNTRLRDPTIRAQVFAMIKNMTSENAALIPSLPQVISTLANLKNECLISPLTKKYRVATLNVNEYLAASEFRQAELRKTLNLCTEVWLLDTEARPDMEYMKIRHKLQETILCVGNQVYIANDLEIAKRKLIADLEAGELQGHYQFPTQEQLKMECQPSLAISRSKGSLFEYEFDENNPGPMPSPDEIAAANEAQKTAEAIAENILKTP